MLGEWRNGSEVLGFEAQPFVGSYAAGHDYTEGHSEFKILCGRNVYDWTNRDFTDETVKTMVVEPLALSKRVEVARRSDAARRAMGAPSFCVTVYILTTLNGR